MIFLKNHAAYSKSLRNITINCIFCLGTLILSTAAAQAQVDSLFWFAPPDASANHEDRPVRFRITAGDEQVTITISMPANPSFPAETFTLNANTSRMLSYNNVALFETLPYGEVARTGVLIKGNGLFTAVYEVGQQLNIDTFVLKGRNAMGQEFIIPGQTEWNNQTSLGDAWSSFDIVATENNTNIQIIPHTAVDGWTLGDTLRIRLNRGETYSVRALSRLAATTLAGSEVFSNRPIAITLKDDSLLKDGCYDLTGDQIVPVGILGQNYILGPADLTDEELAFITAVEDNTEVMINGSLAATLQRGQTFRVPLPSPRFINTTAPVAIMHYTGIGCELGAAMVPSVNCKGSTNVPFVRSSNEEFFLSILVQKAGIDKFTLNGRTDRVTQNQFRAVANTNDLWYRALIPFDIGTIGRGTPNRLENQDHSFQLGVIDGGPGTGTRYGYYSNFSSLYIGDDLSLCPNESRTLEVRAGSNASFLWNDGSTQSTLEVNEPGTYWVRATTEEGCVLTDTLEVFPANNTSLRLPDTVQLCEGTPLTLSTTREFYDYQWNGGGGAGNSSTFEVSQPGLVTVQARNDAGCLDQDTIMVVARQPPPLDLGPNQTVCPDEIITLDARVGESATFLWNGTPGDSLFTIPDSGTYRLEVHAGTCTLYDSVEIAYLPAPLAAPIAGPQVLCPGVSGATYSVADSLGSSYTWLVNGGSILDQSEDNTITVDWAGTNPKAEVWVLETTPQGCTSDTTKLPVKIQVELAPAITRASPVVCLNDSAQSYHLTPTPGSVYTWHLGGGGTFANSNPQDLAEIIWQTPGRWPIWVSEVSTTVDTVCAGVSDTTWVTVYEDSAFLDVYRVTRASYNSNAVEVVYSAGDFANGTQLRLDRRATLAATWTPLTNLAAIPTTTRDAPNFGIAPYYFYQLSGTNGCGEMLITDPQSTLWLSSTIDTITQTATLHWNPYVGWPNGVDHYTIYRQLDHESGFSEYAQVPGTDTSWVYTQGLAAFEHRFYLRAVGHRSVEYSYSQPDTVKFEHPIFFPTAFSPNGDGVNDLYTIGNLHLYQPHTFTIVSRTGKRVLETTAYANDWNGDQLPDGVYFFVFESPLLPRPIRGSISILR